METGDVRDVVRRPLRSGVGAGILGVVALVPLLGDLSARSAGAFIFWTLLLILGAGTAVRMARSGVVVDSTGLTVRDTVRTRRISWDRVQYISPATDDPAFRAVGIVTDEGRLRCHALSALRFERSPSGARLRRLYERLNRHFQAARAAGRCPAAEQAL